MITYSRREFLKLIAKDIFGSSPLLNTRENFTYIKGESKIETLRPREIEERVEWFETNYLGTENIEGATGFRTFKGSNGYYELKLGDDGYKHVYLGDTPLLDTTITNGELDSDELNKLPMGTFVIGVTRSFLNLRTLEEAHLINVTQNQVEKEKHHKNNIPDIISTNPPPPPRIIPDLPPPDDGHFVPNPS